MKKYNLLYILTAGMMLFSSCEDFLNTDSPSEQSKENLFENEGMTRSAIMGSIFGISRNLCIWSENVGKLARSF